MRKDRWIKILRFFLAGLVFFVMLGPKECFADASEGGSQVGPVYVKDNTIFNGMRAIIPAEGRCGLYVLEGHQNTAYMRLWFLSLETGESELLLDEEDLNCDIRKTFLQGETLYILVYQYGVSEGESPMQVWAYDVNTFERTKVIGLNTSVSFSRFGVDSKGRIYASVNDSFDYEKAGETIYRFDADGQLMDTNECPKRIYSYAAFDPVNGNIYFVGDSRGSMYPDLYVGRIPADDDFSKVTWDQLNSLYWRTSNQNATTLEAGRYLIYSSAFDDDKVIVADSNNLDPAEIDPYTTDNEIARLFELERSEEVSGEVSEVYGNRAVYNPINDSFVLTSDDRHVIEVDQKGDRITELLETKEHIFALFRMDGRMWTLELDDDGNYLMESVSVKNATCMEIHADSMTLKARESLSLSVTDDTEDKTEKVEWASSDPRIATVSKAGIVYGVSKGNVTITGKYSNGVQNSIVLTVTDLNADTDPQDGFCTRNTSGFAWVNGGENDYSVWSAPMQSFLYEEGGYLYRLESRYDSQPTAMEYTIHLEQYTLDGEYVKTLNALETEHGRLGGFYKGADAYYLAFIIWDQTDDRTDGDGLLIRKYDRNWNPVAEGSIITEETYRITRAGNLRMTEYDGRLYIHTSNKGYVDSGGTHHQSSGTYIFNESDLSQAHMSYSQVSHSFNQFILEDQGKIYTADHREGWTEDGPCIGRYATDDEFTPEAGVFPFLYKRRGGGDNYDGFSVGGFEVCPDSCLIAYNLDIDGPDTNRNVYLSVTDKELKYSKQILLSDYTAKGDKTGRLPQLVKVNDGLFLVLWEEYDKSIRNTIVRMVLVDSAGNRCSETGRFFGRLSDCEPILNSDGYVVWYYTGRPVQQGYVEVLEDGTVIPRTEFVSEDSAPIVCFVNPFRIPLQGETGWISDVSGTWYYLDSNGQILTDLQEINGVQYLFTDDGKMQTGTVKYNGKIYKIAKSGAILSVQPDPDHVHKWDRGVVTKEPSYTEYGEITYTCKCGETRIGYLQMLQPTDYSEEWVDGLWYNKDGTQTYKYRMAWRHNKKGWWIVDTRGWYPKNQWQKIDGVWYYFKSDGYMAAKEWCNGYWLNKDGSWTYKRKAKWRKDSVGWWFGNAKWYAKKQWQKIDGKWYYFNAKGYMVTGTQTIGGVTYRFDKSGACLNP